MLSHRIRPRSSEWRVGPAAAGTGQLQTPYWSAKHITTGRSRGCQAVPKVWFQVVRTLRRSEG
jgi:hypothetical protein